MSKNRILTPIKGCNSVTNFLKMTLYNHNLDIISVNVYTKFCLILFILCQDIEQNKILTSIKGRNSVANMRKIKLYNPNIDLINDNVQTKYTAQQKFSMDFIFVLILVRIRNDFFLKLQTSTVILRFMIFRVC